jgi:hypothetical protein
MLAAVVSTQLSLITVNRPGGLCSCREWQSLCADVTKG